jgi:hypothetical protein
MCNFDLKKGWMVVRIRKTYEKTGLEGKNEGFSSGGVKFKMSIRHPCSQISWPLDLYLELGEVRAGGRNCEPLAFMPCIALGLKDISRENTWIRLSPQDHQYKK